MISLVNSLGINSQDRSHGKLKQSLSIRFSSAYYKRRGYHKTKWSDAQIAERRRLDELATNARGALPLVMQLLSPFHPHNIDKIIHKHSENLRERLNSLPFFSTAHELKQNC